MERKSRLVFVGSEGTIFRNFSELVVFGPDGLYDRLRVPGMTLVLSEGERNRALWAHLPGRPNRLFGGYEQFWKGFAMGTASIVVLIGILSLAI